MLRALVTQEKYINQSCRIKNDKRMKPVLYRIASKDLTTSESLHKRNLSWFNDTLIVCCLYNTNNWMGKYLTKHLEEIKQEAKLKGFRFFWTEDFNMEEYVDLSIVNNREYPVQAQIEHYLFCDQGGGEVYSDAWMMNSVSFSQFVERNGNKVFKQTTKSSWGIYMIDGLRIEFEKWEPSSGGPMKTVIRRGRILNDTTFVITEKFNHYDGKTYHVQDTFRFREFSPKPDSTNRFIK